MIQSTDLRINNWFNLNGKDFYIDMKMLYAISSGVPDYDLEKIKPIPLAEDRLLKFGFSEKRFRVKSNIEYRLLLPGSTDRTGIPMLPAFLNLQKRNDFFTMQYGNFFLELRFVHQLQNLVYALTGNELTLTSAKENV